MFLSDRDIKAALREGSIRFATRNNESQEEFERRVQPASIDLRVGNSYAVYRTEPGNMALKMPQRLIDIDAALYQRHQLPYGEALVIPPQGFALVPVDAWIGLGSDILGLLAGRSSIARRSLQVEAAGFVDPGFEGVLVCEVVNFAPFPIAIHASDPLCHIAFARLTSPAERPYGTNGLGSRYQGQMGATTPIRERAY